MNKQKKPEIISRIDKLAYNFPKSLEIILNRLANFMEKTAKMIGKVKSAMIYPIVVITIATLVTAVQEEEITQT